MRSYSQFQHLPKDAAVPTTEGVTGTPASVDANGGLQFGNADHGLLAAGSLLDDDHSGYPWRLGRSGGQVLYGGVSAGEVLYLRGTNNATPGPVYLNNDNVGGVQIGGTANSNLSVVGGVHIGGTSDPGNDNLIVDGTATIGSTVTLSSISAYGFIKVNASGQLSRGDIALSDIPDDSVLDKVLHSGGAGNPHWDFLVDANVDATAAIARSKLAAGTAGYVVINALVSGAFSQEQYLALVRGGTAADLSGVAQGGVIYKGASALACSLAGASANEVLHSGVTGVPTWSKIVNADIADTTGINFSKLQTGTPNYVAIYANATGYLSQEQYLSMSRGGTGTTLSPVAGAVVWCNGSVFAQTAAGTAGTTWLQSGGTGTPVWDSIAASDVGPGTFSGGFTFAHPLTIDNNESEALPNLLISNTSPRVWIDLRTKVTSWIYGLATIYNQWCHAFTIGTSADVLWGVDKDYRLLLDDNILWDPLVGYAQIATRDIETAFGLSAGGLTAPADNSVIYYDSGAAAWAVGVPSIGPGAGKGMVLSGGNLHAIQATNYTVNNLVYASGTSTLGQIGNNSDVIPKYLYQVSGGTPIWNQLALVYCSDVSIVGPSANQFLRYVGGYWSNATVAIPSVLGDLTNVLLDSPPSNGDVLAYNTAETAWMNHTPQLGDNSDVASLVTVADGQILVYRDATGLWTPESIPNLGIASLDGPWTSIEVTGSGINNVSRNSGSYRKLRFYGTPSELWVLTGIEAGEDGDCILIFNDCTVFNGTVAAESGDSSAANRIVIGKTYWPRGACAMLFYSTSDNRWHPIVY